MKNLTLIKAVFKVHKHFCVKDYISRFYLRNRYHFVKRVRVRSYSGPYFPAFGLNTDHNNSEYGQFLHSDKWEHKQPWNLTSTSGNVDVNGDTCFNSHGILAQLRLLETCQYLYQRALIVHLSVSRVKKELNLAVQYLNLRMLSGNLEILTVGV